MASYIREEWLPNHGWKDIVNDYVKCYNNVLYDENNIILKSFVLYSPI